MHEREWFRQALGLTSPWQVREVSFDADVPDKDFESKEEVSAWIGRLKDEIQPTLRLTDIHEADVSGVAVHRFRLYCNKGLPDEEHEHLKELGLRYKAAAEEHPPGYQYQRQDRSEVEQVREQVRQRFSGNELAEGFVFERVNRRDR